MQSFRLKIIQSYCLFKSKPQRLLSTSFSTLTRAYLDFCTCTPSFYHLILTIWTESINHTDNLNGNVNNSHKSNNFPWVLNIARHEQTYLNKNICLHVSPSILKSYALQFAFTFHFLETELPIWENYFSAAFIYISVRNSLLLINSFILRICILHFCQLMAVVIIPYLLYYCICLTIHWSLGTETRNSNFLYFICTRKHLYSSFKLFFLSFLKQYSQSGDHWHLSF